MSEYKHGTYGNFAESIGENAANSVTAAVYTGVAPVNLIRGYSAYVNAPVKLSSIADVHNFCGYSEDWASFDLCEAFARHFKNAAGNIGPIVAINVLNPAVHKKADDTTVALTFTNGRSVIKSDTIILDSLVLAEKVEGTDYTVSYDFARGQAVIESIGNANAGSINATYSEVDPSAIDKDDVIGGVTTAGVYTGLGCIGLIYPELHIIPSLILCPKWSEDAEVYNAMILAGTKINGHWDAMVYADIPLVDGSNKVDNIPAAIAWKTSKSYNNERSKVLWPQAKDTLGRTCHTAVLAAWRTLFTDNANSGVPMESPSNKALPIASQYFGVGSVNRGFDQQQANQLNAAGITTIVYWGGQWVLWGPHTAAYQYGAVTDNRNIFDNSIRMMMYVSNSFQADWALSVDGPMTRAMADTIKNREQEKADALVAMGAFIGTPVVEFTEGENTTADMVQGNFTWNFKGTTTPPFKSGTLNVAYTDEGFNTYFGEVS